MIYASDSFDELSTSIFVFLTREISLVRLFLIELVIYEKSSKNNYCVFS